MAVDTESPTPLTQLPQNPEPLPSDVSKYKLATFDQGVFQYELLKLSIVPQTTAPVAAIGLPAPKPTDGSEHRTSLIEARKQGVREGTYQGTRLALTETFKLAENRYMTYFDVAGIDPVFPRRDDLQKKRMTYTWSTPDDRSDTNKETTYPPHCKSVPSKGYVKDRTKADVGDPTNNYVLAQIFDSLALSRVQLLIPKVIPNKWLDFKFTNWVFDKYRYAVKESTPGSEYTMKALRAFNQDQHKAKATAYEEKNIGDREDWYTDAVFAQQQFIGVNPTTLTLLSDKLFEEFLEEAERQGRKDVQDLLIPANRDSLYMQDCSYFREAAGMTKEKDGLNDMKITVEKETRYTTASVSLFHLNPDGRLHPIGIVIDYKWRMVDSVVIFNRRLKPHSELNKPAPGEETDWAWRYAKTCAQSADWIRHEVAVHLVNTHLVEEVIIVSAQRSFEWNHIVLRLLYPHWYKTLPLNQSARDVLVPGIILDIIGLERKQAFKFINYHYDRFDFMKTMVPEDLRQRGFPPQAIERKDAKFSNYGYANNIYPLHKIIRKFVKGMLGLFYTSDAAVKRDKDLEFWCSEMRGDLAGKMKSFPEKIETVEQLVDIVTHCIHIASPLHTAVNYLQQYYLTFVPNKPASLCLPPPSRLADLNALTEKNLVESLPVNRPRDWLLSSHIPYLLSTRGGARENSLAGYACSLWQTYKEKKVVDDEKEDPTGDEHANQIRDYAKSLYDELRAFDLEWPEISGRMWDNSVLYDVLDPDDTAVSILI